MFSFRNFYINRKILENLKTMESEESDRKKKQQFLYSEIIDGGYDAALFQEFLDKKKPNG